MISSHRVYISGHPFFVETEFFNRHGISQQLSAGLHCPWMICTRKQRLAYAWVGLLAGDAVLLLYMLLNALRAFAILVAAHMGEPQAQVTVALQVFCLYATFSVLGWLFVGVPVALFFPVRSVASWSWPVLIAVGALAGPLALLLILVLLGHGRFPSSFVGTGALFAFSILVSTVSFCVYVALLRKQLGLDSARASPR
jgi:hypothetical protein